MSVLPIRDRPPVIFSSTTINGLQIPPHEVVMTLVSCKCQKLATGSCSFQGRLSPTNEEVKINYKGKNYTIILNGEGTYYLVFKDQKLTLHKEENSPRPPCCSPEGLYLTHGFL